MKKVFLLALPLLISSVLVDATAARAACTASASGAFSSGSAVVGNQVVICANSSTSNTAAKTTSNLTTTVVKTPATVVPKPVCPTSVATTAQIVAAALLGCAIPGPSKPPVAVVVTKPKATTTAVVSSASLADQAAFTPNAVTIAVSKTSLSPGESAILMSNAATHERSAAILGRVGYVRFVPVDYSWMADGGWSASGAVAIASFQGVGNKQVSLTVGYQASYRFGLADPWSPVGVVTVSAATSLEVLQPPPPAAKLTPHLVWSNCSVHPSGYRC